jgi:hypothetical protein
VHTPHPAHPALDPLRMPVLTARTMHTLRWVLIALTMLIACKGADDPGGLPPGSVDTAGTGGSPSATATGGSNATGSGGTIPMAGSGSGGMKAGSGGMGMAGMGMAGMGSGGKPAMGTGGMTAGTGGMTAGTGGMTAGTGGMTAGTGGMTGACTPNLACKLAAMPATDDIYQDCVDRINQFRVQCACLPPYARWKDEEDCADTMAMYDSTMPGMAHAGAKAMICGPGVAQNECPGWPNNMQVISGCLQSMWDEGPPPSQPCDGACFQKYGHFINMSSKTSTKVACGFATDAQGKIYAVQNFGR